VALRLLGRPSKNPPGDTKGITNEVVMTWVGPNRDRATGRGPSPITNHESPITS
jgi:hypothetical protein